MINTTKINIIENLPKTFNLGLNKNEDKDLIQVLLSLSLVNKNLYNTTLFVLNQVYTSYEFDKLSNTYNLKLVKLLHIHQKDMINFVNAEISKFNKLRLIQFNKKKKKLELKAQQELEQKQENPPQDDNIDNIDDGNDKPKKKLKDYSEFKFFSKNISRETHDQLLNETFLQYIVDKFSKKQSIEADLPVSDYELLPGRLRQKGIKEAIKNYFTYFKSLKVFSANKTSKGRPSIPKYKSKTSGKTFEFPGTDLTKNKLVKLKHIHHLYKDYDKKIKLSDIEIKAYKNFNYKELLNSVKTINNIDILEKPLLLKFVPKSSKKLIIQVVFNTVVKISTNKVIGKVINKVKLDESFKADKYKNLLSVKNTALVSSLKSIDSKELLNLNIAGIDMGITNVVSTAYYTEELKRGQIYSSKDYTRQMNYFNRKLDTIQKSLANSLVLEVLQKSIDIKEQSLKGLNKKNQIKLSKRDIEILHTYQKSIYENVKYRRILDKKNNFVNDFIHKLTSHVVSNLIKNKVELVIIGKNIGWKTNSNMGKRMNRAFYSIPHAQIINMLKYKCYENNILLVTTEESYTSKSSFINNANLKQFDINNNKYVEQSEYIDIYKLDDKVNYTKDNEIEDSKIEEQSKNNVIGKILIKDKANSVSKELKINKKPGTVKTSKTNSNIVSGNKKYKEHIYTDKIAEFGGLRDPLKTRRYKNINCEPNNKNKAKYTFIHSDLNGAYNIIKKIINIKYKKPTSHTQQDWVDKKYCSRKCDIFYTNLLFKQKVEQYA